MEFRVFTPGAGRESFDGKAKYDIALNGVLTASGDDGQQTIYGPSGWLKIELGPEPYPLLDEAALEHEDF